MPPLTGSAHSAPVGQPLHTVSAGSKLNVPASQERHESLVEAVLSPMWQGRMKMLALVPPVAGSPRYWVDVNVKLSR